MLGTWYITLLRPTFVLLSSAALAVGGKICFLGRRVNAWHDHNNSADNQRKQLSTPAMFPSLGRFQRSRNFL